MNQYNEKFKIASMFCQIYAPIDINLKKSQHFCFKNILLNLISRKFIKFI